MRLAIPLLTFTCKRLSVFRSEAVITTWYDGPIRVAIFLSFNKTSAVSATCPRSSNHPDGLPPGRFNEILYWAVSENILPASPRKSVQEPVFFNKHGGCSTSLGTPPQVLKFRGNLHCLIYINVLNQVTHGNNLKMIFKQILHIVFKQRRLRIYPWMRQIRYSMNC